MSRPRRPLAVPPVAALAALSAALLLSAPAGARGLAAEPTRHAATRDALASLIETLNDAARCLAGVATARTAVVADRPAVAKPVIATADRAAPLRAADAVPPPAPPLRAALHNLPPPTR